MWSPRTQRVLDCLVCIVAAACFGFAACAVVTKSMFGCHEGLKAWDDAAIFLSLTVGIAGVCGWLTLRTAPSDIHGTARAFVHMSIGCLSIALVTSIAWLCAIFIGHARYEEAKWMPGLIMFCLPVGTIAYLVAHWAQEPAPPEPNDSPG